MADDKTNTDDNQDGNQTPPPLSAPGGSIDRLPVVIHSQYIKDLSFENPNAPRPLQGVEGQPGVNVDFSMDAKKLDLEDIEDAYEVTLYVNVRATKGESISFIAELEYAMMVSVTDVPEEKIHPLLLIEMPAYLFPYARQIISDVTQQAGFAPFMLSPVNFKGLYRKQFGGPKPNTPQAQKSQKSPSKESESEAAE